jgi:TonB-dependent receptor
MIAGAIALPSTALAQGDGDNADDEDVIVVKGFRSAIQSANQLERDADQFKSIVTADDIGQFGDPTVAETLQRVPGVSINRTNGEGQQVSVRGLPTEFATITLDGARLGTSDPEVNSTNLDFFSADNLSQIEVIKTLLPEMEADAIAGTVNLKSISALSRGRDSIGARAEVGYQEKNEAFNPRFSGEFTKIFDLDASRIGIAGSITYLQRETATDQVEAGDGLFFMVLDGDEWDNDADDCTDGDAITECYLVPNEFDLRSDIRDRERISLNGQVEWELENHLFAVRGSFSDSDTFRLNTRSTFDLSRSEGDFVDINAPGFDPGDVDEVVEFGLEDDGEIFGVFEDGRSERRIRPGDETDRVYTIAFEGTSEFKDTLTFNYGVDISRNKEETQILEARFRSDNITQTFSNLGQEGVDISLSPEIFDVDDDDPDPTTAAGFPINNTTINGEQFGTPNERFSMSEDNFNSYYLNIEKKFELFGREAAAKFGGQYRERERIFDFDRIEYLVDAGTTLADFNPAPQVENTDLFIPFSPSTADIENVLRDLIADGRVGTVAERGTFITRLNLQQDFMAEEEVWSGYGQFTIEPLENLQIIAGVRVESTDYTSTGAAFREVVFSNNTTDVLTDALEAGGLSDDEIAAFSLSRQDNAPFGTLTGGNSYTEVFPSVNVRWEPVDTMVVRASYTEGIKRPEFGEAAAIQRFRTEELTDEDTLQEVIDDTFGGSLASVDEANLAIAEALLREGEDGQFESEGVQFRDPTLDPLTSNNFDLSVAWYPNDDTAISVAGFYKQIDNFIVPISLAGDDVTTLGLQVDDFTIDSTGVSSVDTFVNGDEAEIYGVEISYYQAYRFLPGLLSGLFVQGNATFADSEATAVQVDRAFPFPDQSDIIGNVSVGWENETFSLRGAMVHQGERLRALNDAGLDDANDPAGDVLEESRTQFDINARWQVADAIQIYFDAINITDAEDNRYYRGGNTVLNGSIFREREATGATYQIGVRARF